MSERKNKNTFAYFIKKNLYYLVTGISLLIIAAVITVVLVTNKKPIEGSKPDSVPGVESELPSSGDEPKTPDESKDKPDKTGESEKPANPDAPDDKEDESGKTTDNKIVFSLPVANSTVIKSFTSSTVVFNKTLGVYTGHMGIDFAAEAGTAVVAAYDGTIESVTSSYLQGTTITINHGNGLKTIYNSVEANENLAEGQKVKKGDTIATVSDNNRQEYKDGAHLHFEVIENGKKIDPETYLLSAEK